MIKRGDTFQKYQTAWIREWRRNNREEQMFRRMRGLAKKKGIPFDIEVSDIVIPETCPILGIKLFFMEGNRSDNTPSLDKIEPSKGYVKGNIQVISWRANRIKNDSTLEELIALGKWAESEVSRSK